MCASQPAQRERLLRSYDEHSHAKFPPGDPSKRAFTYFVLTGGRFVYASALRLLVLKLVLSMTVRSSLVAAASPAPYRYTSDGKVRALCVGCGQASKDVLAMASLEVDLAKVAMGQTITVKWRGKPVFIRRRSEEEIESARQVDVSTLRDPQTDEERVQNPEVSLPRLPEQLYALHKAGRRALRCRRLAQRKACRALEAVGCTGSLKLQKLSQPAWASFLYAWSALSAVQRRHVL